MLYSLEIFYWKTCSLFLLPWKKQTCGSINAFFLFMNASCKLSGTAVHLEKVSVWKKFFFFKISMSASHKFKFSWMGVGSPIWCTYLHTQLLSPVDVLTWLDNLSFLFLTEEAEIHSPNGKKVIKYFTTSEKTFTDFTLVLLELPF